MVSRGERILLVALLCICGVVLIPVAMIIAPVIFLLNWFSGWISGENRWYRKRRAEFHARKPLTDGKFVELLDIPSEQARICIEVRRACANSCGLRADSLYPDDSMPLFYRMMSPWGGALDIAFRVEKALNVKIDNNKAMERWSHTLAHGEKATLAQFADGIASAVIADEVASYVP